MSQKSQVSRIVKVIRNCQSCQQLSKLLEIVMSPHLKSLKVSGIALWRCSLNVFVFVFVFVIVFFFGWVMSPRHSDQMSQRSQVSTLGLLVEGVL